MSFSFDYPCSQVGKPFSLSLPLPPHPLALPLCPLIKQGDPQCYSRNIELGGQLIFEPATLVVNVIGIRFPSFFLSLAHSLALL